MKDRCHATCELLDAKPQHAHRRIPMSHRCLAALHHEGKHTFLGPCGRNRLG